MNSLSLNAQAKLLRFLECGEFRSVGTDRVKGSDVWVLAATNRDLGACVSEGSFREDLLYRLDVVRIDVPPLEHRAEDVPLLARFFLDRVAPDKRFSAAALAAMSQHEWPGNVRELKHRVESAALFAGPVIEPGDLRLTPTSSVRATAEGLEDQLWSLVERQGYSLADAVGLCERLIVQGALKAEDDNRTRAAQRLGIHVRTIFKKLAR